MIIQKERKPRAQFEDRQTHARNEGEVSMAQTSRLGLEHAAI